MHAQVADESAEVLVLGDEIRFARNFDQHADLVVGVYIGFDNALFGRAARLFSGGCDALLAEDFDGGFLIALRFDEGFFALHHSRTRARAQVAYHFSGDFHKLCLGFFDFFDVDLFEFNLRFGFGADFRLADYLRVLGLHSPAAEAVLDGLQRRFP